MLCRMSEATGEATGLPRFLDRGPTLTLGAVVGENVRRLREGQALTQHELAQVWKRHGLNWARSKIAALEGGSRPRVDFAELVMMASGLQVAMAALLDGEGQVHLAPTPAIVSREALRTVVDGGQLGIYRLTAGPELEAADEHLYGIWDRTQPAEADRELARRLDVPTDVVVKAAMDIFDGRTLTSERDRRVANLGPMTMSERMAHRGHVTRELATSVEEYMNREAGER